MPKEDDKPEGLVAQLETLSKAVTMLTDGFSTMQKNVDGLTSNVDGLTNNVNTYMETVNNPKPKPDEKPVIGDEDLERMDRKSFLGVIREEMKEVVSELAGNVNNEITEVKSTVSKSSLEQEVQQVIKDNPDFMEWKDEIGVLAKENPGLSIKRMYTLAKTENPEKVEELKEKYPDKEESDETKKPGYGGLTPAGGTRTDAPTDMDSETAAENAWEQTMQNVDLQDGG